MNYRIREYAPFWFDVEVKESWFLPWFPVATFPTEEAAKMSIDNVKLVNTLLKNNGKIIYKTTEAV